MPAGERGFLSDSRSNHIVDAILDIGEPHRLVRIDFVHAVCPARFRHAVGELPIIGGFQPHFSGHLRFGRESGRASVPAALRTAWQAPCASPCRSGTASRAGADDRSSRHANAQSAHRSAKPKPAIFIAVRGLDQRNHADLQQILDLDGVGNAAMHVPGNLADKRHILTRQALGAVVTPALRP
jgi:hypothetical protein